LGGKDGTQDLVLLTGFGRIGFLFGSLTLEHGFGCIVDKPLLGEYGNMLVVKFLIGLYILSLIPRIVKEIMSR
jgi:hypothetical protein